MVMMGRGVNATADLIFLEGNERERYTRGPESMFIANVRVEEYLTLHKVPHVRYIRNGWWFTRQTVYVDDYVFLPYLMVDMNHVMDWFSDRTCDAPYTNKHLGGPETPLQLVPMTRQDLVEPTDDILKKFKKQYADRFVSWKLDGPTVEAQEQFFGTFVDIVNGVEITKIANGRNRAIFLNGLRLDQARERLPRRPDHLRYNLYGDQQAAFGTHEFNEYRRRSQLVAPNTEYAPFIIKDRGIYPLRFKAPRDMIQMASNTNPLYFTGAPMGNRIINWVTVGTVGISGIGIINKIQGAEPHIVDSPFEDFSTYTKLPIDSLGTRKLYTLPFKTHRIVRKNAASKTSEEGLTFYVPGGFPEYAEADMDVGLKYAIANLATRATFFKVHEFATPYLVGIDVPFRSLLNICLEQSSYFTLLKNLLTDTLDFEILRRMLGEFVDKSVQKANGLSKGEKIDADSMHPLYNHWLARLIDLLADPIYLEDTRERIKTEFDKKAAKYEWAIATLTPACEKVGLEWTWREIMSAYDVAREMAKETRITLVEEFMLGYLNLLYEYRKFFICKRFNKEDGTMWVMRALESVLNYLAPAALDDDPPPSPAMLADQNPSYRIAFYEIQNRTSSKIDAFVNSGRLEEDRTMTVYVKVNWVGVKAYNRWVAYHNDPANEPEAPEVVRIVRDGRRRYAIKPKDGTYTLLSKELLDNDARIKYNSLHPTGVQRDVRDIDRAAWYITWGDEPTLTPIRWNVFVNLDPDSILEYADAAITPEEFVCLAEKGADFWTVHIPQSLWPRTAGYKTRIRLKKYELEIRSREISNDPYITVLGNQGYRLWPIADKQKRPMPGITGESPLIAAQLAQL
jgi:hypothetical protein